MLFRAKYLFGKHRMWRSQKPYATLVQFPIIAIPGINHNLLPRPDELHQVPVLEDNRGADAC